MLCENNYVPIARDADGGLSMAVLGLRFVLWQGEFDGIEATWLRWADAEGLLPLPVEVASQQAEAERARADMERERADTAEQELARLCALLAQQDNASPGNG